MPVAERDRVELYYERSGNGDLELLFVHGWCCDRTFFQPQVDHFAQSCSVTVVDLRGCGRSGRADDGYDIPSLADDLAPSARTPASRGRWWSATASAG